MAKLHITFLQCICVSAYVDTHLAEQSYQYLTTGEDLRGLQEEPRSRHKVVILFHRYLHCLYIVPESNSIMFINAIKG